MVVPVDPLACPALVEVVPGVVVVAALVLAVVAAAAVVAFFGPLFFGAGRLEVGAAAGTS